LSSKSSSPTNPATKTPEFDPHAPFVDEKGYDYDDFAAFLAGRKENCWRNREIESIWSVSGKDPSRARRYVGAVRHCYDKDGNINLGLGRPQQRSFPF
jgi:hypothetical protein